MSSALFRKCRQRFEQGVFGEVLQHLVVPLVAAGPLARVGRVQVAGYHGSVQVHASSRHCVSGLAVAVRRQLGITQHWD